MADPTGPPKPLTRAEAIRYGEELQACLPRSKSRWRQPRRGSDRIDAAAAIADWTLQDGLWGLGVVVLALLAWLTGRSPRRH